MNYEFHTEEKEKQKRCIKKTLNVMNFIEELAFHEASHFVFNCIAENLNLGFLPVTSIEICTLKYDGRVYGLTPDMPKNEIITFFNPKTNKTEIIGGLKKFYTSKPERLVIRILSTLAGFVSYQVFIEDTPFFIGDVDADKGKISYYSIETFNIPSSNGSQHDFENVRRYLDLLGRYNWRKDCLPFIEEVKIIMNTPPINEAIRLTKTHLIKNDCKQIKGKSLQALKSDINNIIKKITLKDVIDKLISF